MDKWIKKLFGNVVFFADGDAGGDGDGSGAGGDGDGNSSDWQTQVGYLKDNPEALKTFAKYTSLDEAFKGAHEAIKMTGQPYKLPSDYSKLTDDQKAEIKSSVAGLYDVPENPDGYDLKIAKDKPIPIDDQGMADFKIFCKENNVPKDVAQKLVDFQVGSIERLNQTREDIIKDMTQKNFEAFSKEVGGDSAAVLRMQWVREFLQSQCLGEDGKPDQEVWEAFEKRIMYNDRMIELPLLRALSKAAQLARGEGGAPDGGAGSGQGKGIFNYPEMNQR